MEALYLIRKNLHQWIDSTSDTALLADLNVIAAASDPWSRVSAAQKHSIVAASERHSPSQSLSTAEVEAEADAWLDR